MAVWGEDEESLGNVTAQSPQPVLFNLCVAAEARRRGVALALIRRCEEACQSWGDGALYLKVREENMRMMGAEEDILLTSRKYVRFTPPFVSQVPSWCTGGQGKNKDKGGGKTCKKGKKGKRFPTPLRKESGARQVSWNDQVETRTFATDAPVANDSGSASSQRLPWMKDAKKRERAVHK